MINCNIGEEIMNDDQVHGAHITDETSLKCLCVNSLKC